MRIQNFILPNTVCETQELYIRGSTVVNSSEFILYLKSKEKISSDTYMNILDLYEWRTYTIVKEIQLHIVLKGLGILRVFLLNKGKSLLLKTHKFSYIQAEELLYNVPCNIEKGLIYWEIEAIGDTCILEAYYNATLAHCNNIKLGLNICTYKRNQQLRNNLKRLYESEFFKEDSIYNRKLEIYITDNGDDFITDLHHEDIHIYRNSNRGGGTGGFTYGLDKITENNQYKSDNMKITHVIFMDDDVEFMMESFYRVYAFLSYFVPTKKEVSIAGRMFRMDQRHIQYTAREIWNQGNIIHIGGELDVSVQDNLEEDKQVGDYGGWWFCVYPITYTNANRPFPFYLHCDDVEYGLRFNQEVINLKGVQVWHETYTYRQNPQITYYDIRNSAVVNAMYGYNTEQSKFIETWGNHVGYFHAQKLLTHQFAAMVAMWDFMKGQALLCSNSEMPKRYKNIAKYPWLVKFIIPILWRVISYKLNRRFNQVIQSYKVPNEYKIV